MSTPVVVDRVFLENASMLRIKGQGLSWHSVKDNPSQTVTPSR